MLQTLAHYRIEALLGEGSFAWVYRAFDEKFERTVALKLLKPIWLSDPQAIARFKQEAKTMAKLRHPHIVDVYDVGESEGQIYLSQLLVAGETLADRLGRGPLRWDKVIQIVTDIGSALDYAHGQGIIHRDVKPQNILLDKQSQAYLGDFGLVRAVEGSTRLSSTVSLIGTAHYMAPEIWDGEAATPATDVYALTCVTFEMITGEVLFEGSSMAAVMKQHIVGPQFPTEWPAGVPDGVVQILRKGLIENPMARMRRGGELATALAALSVSRQPTPPAIDVTESTYGAVGAAKAAKGGLPWRWIVVGVVAAAIIIGAIVFLTIGTVIFLTQGSGDNGEKVETKATLEFLAAVATEQASAGTTPEVDIAGTVATQLTAAAIELAETRAAKATDTPSPEPTFTPVPPTNTVTATSVPTDTSTPKPTATARPTHTHTPPPADTATPTPTPSPTPSEPHVESWQLVSTYISSDACSAAATVDVTVPINLTYEPNGTLISIQWYTRVWPMEKTGDKAYHGVATLDQGRIVDTVDIVFISSGSFEGDMSRVETYNQTCSAFYKWRGTVQP